MGLRGSVAFIPLCTALFMPGKVPPQICDGSHDRRTDIYTGRQVHLTSDD